MTTPPDPRATFRAALDRLESAHGALALHVSDEMIEAYCAACRDARVAFEALKLAGFERAAKCLRRRT